MKILKDVMWNHKRWFPLVLLFGLIGILWFNRKTIIYSRLPSIFGRMQIYVFDLVFISVALTVLITIYTLIKCPPLVRGKVDRAFRQAGLRNGNGEYPALIAVANDPSKLHGKRYTIRNVGIAIPDMENKIERLQRELGVIYELQYSRNPSLTYLYVLPARFARPTIMPPADDEEF